MESSFGTYDLEMSLFNGDLQLVGLTSFAEAELPTLPGQDGLLTKGYSAPSNDGAHQGGLLGSTFTPGYGQGSDLLDLDWPDTTVTLTDLLLESEENLAATLKEPIVPPSVPSINTSSPDGQTVAPVSAEDFFKSIEAGTSTVSSLDAFQTTEADLEGQMLVEALNKLSEELSPPLDSRIAALSGSESVLSPVSAEDVESILSYPSSPLDFVAETDATDDPEYLPRTSVTTGSRSRKRKTPSGDEDDLSFVVDKKQRKKIQNKTAATRYRQKKKSEQTLLDEECDVLELKNKELKDKVESMTQEIKYLKNLMSEVYEAKQKNQAIV